VHREPVLGEDQGLPSTTAEAFPSPGWNLVLGTRGGGHCLVDLWRGPACPSRQPRRFLWDPAAFCRPLWRTFNRVIKRCFSAGLIFTSQTYGAFAWLQTSVRASERLFSERVGQENTEVILSCHCICWEKSLEITPLSRGNVIKITKSSSQKLAHAGVEVAYLTFICALVLVLSNYLIYLFGFTELLPVLSPEGLEW